MCFLMGVFIFMLNILFKKNEFRVVAPVSGKLICINKVKDEVFSAKMMGNGFAIIPSERYIYSPVEGKIVTVFPTKHAIGLCTKEGLEVIVHIGVNTVNLNGKGFKTFVKENDRVKQGQKLVAINEELFNDDNNDLTTIVVFPSGIDCEIKIDEKDVVKKEGIIK